MKVADTACWDQALQIFRMENRRISIQIIHSQFFLLFNYLSYCKVMTASAAQFSNAITSSYLVLFSVNIVVAGSTAR